MGAIFSAEVDHSILVLSAAFAARAIPAINACAAPKQRAG